ncbi:MAG: ABC transporter substrate-binding protein [Candidatus Bipolaricaulaceae bacterium]
MSGLIRLLCLAFLLPVVVGGAAQQFPVTVIDDRGVEITLPEPPERIVALAPLYCEILLDVGAAERLVGVASSPDNPSEVAALPQVGPSFSPTLEEIVALAPDLVLGGWGEVRRRLEELGLTVLTAGGQGGYIASLPELFAAVGTVGAAAGCADRARALVGEVARRVIAVEAAVLDLPPVHSAFLYLAAPAALPYVAGRDTIEHRLMARAGGENVFADVAGFPQVSLEEVLARDPAVIFTDPAQVEHVLQTELLASLAAVRAGRVYGIKASAVVSTRVGDTLAEMAALLHPEAAIP